MPSSDLTEFMLIPYLRGGRDSNGCDCWGLTRLILNKEAGLHLPEQDRLARSSLFAVAGVIKDNIDQVEWNEVGEPKTWDVVLMSGQAWYKKKWFSGLFHIGIFIDGKILHTESDTGAVFLPVGHRAIKHRINSFYRHESLTQ